MKNVFFFFLLQYVAQLSWRHFVCRRHVSDFMGHRTHYIFCRLGPVLNCGLSQAGCQLGLHNAGPNVQERSNVGAATEQCWGACQELSSSGEFLTMYLIACCEILVLMYALLFLTDFSIICPAQYSSSARGLCLYAYKEFIAIGLRSCPERFQLSALSQLFAGSSNYLVSYASCKRLLFPGGWWKLWSWNQSFDAGKMRRSVGEAEIVAVSIFSLYISSTKLWTSMFE